MVFSIIYNKKFFVIPHSKTSTRVAGLLQKLNIYNRIFYNLDEFKKIDYENAMDYQKVIEKIEDEKKMSTIFYNILLWNKKSNKEIRTLII